MLFALGIQFQPRTGVGVGLTGCREHTCSALHCQSCGPS